MGSVELDEVESKSTGARTADAAKASRTRRNPSRSNAVGATRPSASGTAEGASVCQPCRFAWSDLRLRATVLRSTPCGRHGSTERRSACPTSAGCPAMSWRMAASVSSFHSPTSAQLMRPSGENRRRFDGQQCCSREGKLAKMDQMPVVHASVSRPNIGTWERSRSGWPESRLRTRNGVKRAGWAIGISFAYCGICLSLPGMIGSS